MATLQTHAAPSHTDVWDDSLLQNSWNEALAEYKKYHSIAATGEDIDAILAADAKAANSLALTVSIDGGGGGEVRDGEMEEGEVMDGYCNGDGNAQGAGSAAATARFLGSEVPPTQPQPPLQEQEGVHDAPPVPVGTGVGQSVADQVTMPVEDGVLKNLMMSWYYAGYYTGYYEGQQQEQKQEEQKQQA